MACTVLQFIKCEQGSDRVFDYVGDLADLLPEQVSLHHLEAVWPVLPEGRAIARGW